MKFIYKAICFLLGFGIAAACYRYLFIVEMNGHVSSFEIGENIKWVFSGLFFIASFIILVCIIFSFFIEEDFIEDLQGVGQFVFAFLVLQVLFGMFLSGVGWGDVRDESVSKFKSGFGILFNDEELAQSNYTINSTESANPTYKVGSPAWNQAIKELNSPKEANINKGTEKDNEQKLSHEEKVKLFREIGKRKGLPALSTPLETTPSVKSSSNNLNSSSGYSKIFDAYIIKEPILTQDGDLWWLSQGKIRGN